MTSTVYVDNSLPAVNAAWLNDVNNFTYNGLGTGSVPGASVIQYQGVGTGAVVRPLSGKIQEAASVLDYIPVSEHAAIKAYTSTLDVSSYINLALAANAVVYMPAGQYRCLFPINLTARRSASAYWGRHLIGAGVQSTVIDSYTGVYPCIDATGQNTGRIEGINFRSDNPPAGLGAADCASIGLKMGRGNVSQSCNQLVLLDLRFNLTSDMTRNGGNGTVGICNHASEHLIADQIQIYANLPLASQNVMQFAVSFSSNIPTIGVNYEQPYVGAAVSCTIHEWSNMQLISWDSFRAMWMYQCAAVSFPNLYTSTRKLVSSVPAQKETFYFTGSCANVFIDCYQEVSGLFGATYRMDHRYLTIEGLNENINITCQRGIGDYGFTIPGGPEYSVVLLASSTLKNSNINCNYTDGIYVSSGDNNGFIALPVALTGAACVLQSVTFTLDHSGSHSSNIFSAIGPYCVNVESINYRSGDTRRCDGVGGLPGNNFTVTVEGLTTPGVATYTFRSGQFERQGGWCNFTLAVSWSAHTGTGGLVIKGLPYSSDVNQNQMVPIYFDGLVVDAGTYQAVGWIANNSTQIQIRKCATAGGAALQVVMDTAVSEILITGTYKVAD